MTAPYYPSGSYVLVQPSLEAVNSDGTSSYTFPSNGQPITVMGIVLNNPPDMLNTTPSYNTIPYDLGGQWQIFIQAYSDLTVGGRRATLAGRRSAWDNATGTCSLSAIRTTSIREPTVHRGKRSQPSGAVAEHERRDDFASGEQWQQRQSGLWPSSGTVLLQAGDVVAVTSYGLEYEGMVNINQQHNVSNPMSITVSRTGGAAARSDGDDPQPTHGFQRQFLFRCHATDHAEHLQGTLVQLDSVRVVSGTWAREQCHDQRRVPAADGVANRRQLESHRRADGGLQRGRREDQESAAVSPTGGYTLWVTDSSSVTSLLGGGTFQWTGSGTSWNGNGNWSLPGKPGNPGDVAIFSDALSAAATVTLDGPQTAGGLMFANANTATTGYTLTPGASGTLTLDNFGSAAFVTVTSGSHAIMAPLTIDDNLLANVYSGASLAVSDGISQGTSGLSLTLQGGGTLVLGGTSNYAGGTTVVDGTLIVEDAAALADGAELIIGSATGAFGNVIAAEGARRQCLSRVPWHYPRLQLADSF